MKHQRTPNQAIELLKDMRDWSATEEQLKMQRRSAKIASWTLYITIATFFVALATLLANIVL